MNIQRRPNLLLEWIPGILAAGCVFNIIGEQTKNKFLAVRLSPGQRLLAGIWLILIVALQCFVVFNYHGFEKYAISIFPCFMWIPQFFSMTFRGKYLVFHNNKKFTLNFLLLVFLYFLIFYCIGFFAGCAKVDISVKNKSGSSVINVAIEYDRTKHHFFGDLIDGEIKKISFVPSTDSSILLFYICNSKNYKLKTGYTTRSFSDAFEFLILKDKVILINRTGRMITLHPKVVE